MYVPIKQMTQNDLYHIERFQLLGKSKSHADVIPSGTTHIYVKDDIRFFLKEKPARTVETNYNSFDLDEDPAGVCLPEGK